MRTAHALLSLLLLAACQGETGIDRSVVTGRIRLLPGTLEEGTDGVARPNDDGFVGLPDLTFRHMTVQGSARSYRSENNATDIDLYFTRTTASGPLRMSFEYATEQVFVWPSREELFEGEVPRFVDTVVYKVEIVDPAWIDEETGDYKVLASFDDDDGYGGRIEFDWAEVSVPTVGGGQSQPYADGVPAGTQIGVRVLAIRGDSNADTSYRLAFSGHDPNQGRILVGAYESSEPGSRGSPVMGGSAFGFWWDEASLSWNGWYRLEGGARRVVECEQGDRECLDSVGSGTARALAPEDTGGDTGASDGGTSDGGASDGGTTDGGTSDGGASDGGTSDGGTTDGGASDGGTTDGGASDGGATDGGASDGGTTDGGAGDGGADDGEEPRLTGAVAEGVEEVWLMAGTFKSLAGAIPGGTYYSTTPVQVRLNGGYVDVATVLEVDDLSPKVYGWSYTEDGDGSLDAPLPLPEPTGPGFVDLVDGNLVYAIDDPQGNNENDAFAFTPGQDLNGLFTASWTDSATNLDLYLLDDAGNYLAAAYLLGDNNPEGFNALDDFDVVFTAGSTYVLLMETWTGPAGPKDYTIEVEWYEP